MKNLVEFLKLTPLYEIVLPIIFKMELRNWYRRNQSIPTPKIIKYEMIRDLGKKFSVKTLVETGTYLGTMISQNKIFFDQIYTIELDQNLYKRARNKFSSLKNVKVIRGDSGKVLPIILRQIKQPTLFWLDAHYSGGLTSRGKQDTPITKELNSIFASKLKNHIVLIDDANCFTGKNGYPKIKELKELVSRKYPRHNFEIRHNIILICPMESS